MSMQRRAAVFISGLVQGVAFRWHVRDQAESLGLTGFVRNLSDGRVEVVLEGEEKEIRKAIERLKTGSRWAKVENIETKWDAYRGEFNNFEIKF